MPSLLSAPAEGAGAMLRTGGSGRAASRALCCGAEPAEVWSAFIVHHAVMPCLLILLPVHAQGPNMLITGDISQVIGSHPFQHNGQ